MTQEFLQDAVVADLEQLFRGENLKNSAGVERRIRVYPQDPVSYTHLTLPTNCT